MAMDPDRFKRAQEIFEVAVERPRESRGDVVRGECAEDEQLRGMVERLLHHHDEGMGEFLNTPAYPPDQRAEGGAGTTLIVRGYEIVRLIGDGGMGVVYEARQKNPSRTVALKFVHPGMHSRDMLRRFRQEADVLAQLQHPGIAGIYEAGTAEVPAPGGDRRFQPFLSMEFVRGRTLTRYAREESLSLEERLALMAKICDAVQYAHQKGFIHRDIKPANILVDENGQPKILDFGVARVTNPDIQATTIGTRNGQLIGTLPYMSPEQATGDSRLLDTRSDVYALGVILYELLCGMLPYDLDDKPAPEAARVIRDCAPARLSSHNVACRGEIDAIVGKALAKERSRRYQSAADLAGDIRRWLAGEPIDAKRDSGLYLFRKLLKRYRFAVGAGATAIIFVTVSAVALGFMYRAQSMARMRAENEAAKAKSVTGLLREMLGSADPANTNPRDYTVRQLLDDFTGGLSGQLQGQPAVEAAVRQTIGVTYRSLGLYPQAETQLRTAVEMNHRLYGDANAETIDSLNELGELLYMVGAQEESERCMRRALEAARRLWDEPQPATAVVLNNLGMLMQSKGDRDEAEALLREALVLRRRMLGDQHSAVAQSLNNLAVLYRTNEEYTSAEPLYREALELNRKIHGDEHPDTARSVNNLALLLHYLGKYDEAEPLYREALRARRKLLGEDHPELASTLNSLAGLLHMRGDLDAATLQYREALAIRRRALPPDHPAVGRSAANLASVLLARGDHVAAEALYREAARISRLACPEGDRAVAEDLASVAVVLIAQGRHDEAEPVVHEALVILRKTLGSDHWATGDMERLLAQCLVARGEYESAESLLRHCHELWHADGGPLTPAKRKSLDRTLRQTVQLYEAWGKPAQADLWREKLTSATVSD